VDQARLLELESVRKWFRRGAWVVDVGAGSGLQANIIASWGCRVLPVDIQTCPSSSYCTVVRYDGTSLPAPTKAMDIVFSSNVLEHVEDSSRNLLLKEVIRVLKPDGLFICILPSAAWRLWTSAAHYVFAVEYLCGRRAVAGGDAPNLRDAAAGMGYRRLVTRMLIPRPHGVDRTSLAELISFQATRWIGLLEKGGFQLLEQESNGLFYTGYNVLPRLGVRSRVRLASILGSACHAFVLRKGCNRP
jgi:SAM-dependent methyltransferase